MTDFDWNPALAQMNISISLAARVHDWVLQLTDLVCFFLFFFFLFKGLSMG